MGFVDSSGRSLSPIPGGSRNSNDSQDDENPQEKREMRQWAMAQSANFEKNIPEVFQRAFLAEQAVRPIGFILVTINFNGLTFCCQC